MNSTLQNELLRDEQVLWEGQPSTLVKFTSADLFMIPFSILWCGFAIFWEAMAIISGAPFFFALFGIPFIIVGLYIVFGRFIYKNHRKNMTYYAITNKRVISIVDSSTVSVDAEYIDKIPCMNKTVRPDGIGTITFGYTPVSLAMYANSGMELLNRSNGRFALAFYDIEDADKVYGIINELRNK